MRTPVIIVKRNGKEYFNVLGTEYPRHKNIPIVQDALAASKFADRMGYITDARALEAYALSIK